MDKKIIRLTESDLHRIVKESVNMVLKETFMDNLKTKASYVKNKLKDNFPPFNNGADTTDTVIHSCNFHIERMEEILNNKEKCSHRFLHAYEVAMKAAEKYGYVNYYKKMRQLYDQMFEEGLNPDDY